MAHSVLGYVLYVSMWFDTKFVRAPKFLIKKIIFVPITFIHLKNIFQKIGVWLWQFISLALINFALGGVTFFTLSVAGLFPKEAASNENAFLFVLLNNLREAFAAWIALNLVLLYGQKLKPRYKQYGLLMLGTHFLESIWIAILIKNYSLTSFLKRLVSLHPTFFIFQIHVFIAVCIVYYLQTREQKRTRKITEQEYQLLLLQELKTKAELEALQAKVSPHFLYNSLNSVAGLIHIDAEKAEKMVLLLAKFFRYSTRLNQGYHNSIENEIEMVQTYLEVEMVRFEDRLEYTIEIENESLKKKLIPSFLLQPLVENAIKHGTSKLAQKGTLTIRIYTQNEYTCLQICDNGKPFPAELNVGYGLQSTQDKIKMLGGEGANMQIQNEPEKAITIRLI